MRNGTVLSSACAEAATGRGTLDLVPKENRARLARTQAKDHARRGLGAIRAVESGQTETQPLRFRLVASGARFSVARTEVASVDFEARSEHGVVQARGLRAGELAQQMRRTRGQTQNA